jgi:hypothetical protein
MKQHKKIADLTTNDNRHVSINLLGSGAESALVELVIAGIAEEGLGTASSLTIPAKDFTDACLAVLRYIMGAE